MLRDVEVKLLPNRYELGNRLFEAGLALGDPQAFPAYCESHACAASSTSAGATHQPPDYH